MDAGKITKTNTKELPQVVISLLNWMNYQDTLKCIASLKKLNYPNFTILVRDNSSPNDSFNQLKNKHPEIQIFKSAKNNGFAAGHYENYLIAKELKTDLFWILNSDLEVFENTLEELVKAYLELGDNIYGSVSLNTKEPELIDFGGAVYNTNSNSMLTYNSWKHKNYADLIKEHPSHYDVESVEGSSMLIPMEVISKYGFMQDDFFMYAEETDYCYRMRKQNVRSIIVTKSCVKHGNEGSTQIQPNLKLIPIYYRRRNSLRFSIEHLGMPRWKALAYQNGTIQNLKAYLKGKLSKKKESHYFYALACVHAFLGKKGKIVEPENLLN